MSLQKPFTPPVASIGRGSAGAGQAQLPMKSPVARSNDFSAAGASPAFALLPASEEQTQSVSAVAYRPITETRLLVASGVMKAVVAAASEAALWMAPVSMLPT